MMIRLSSALAGVLSAGTTAALELGASASPPVTFLWSAGVGLLTAGFTYGVLSNKVTNANARITAEKTDRERAVSELRADVHRGFDGLERRLEEQTRTVIEAMARMMGER